MPLPVDADHPVIACYGGPDSAGAVQLGALLAAAVGQPLMVASAYRYEPLALSARALGTPENERRFDAALARVERAGHLVGAGVECRERVLPAEGVPEALVDLAREIDACALVLGRDLDGSVTRSVLQHAPCPLAISPYSVPVPREEPLRRIGVAYDASPAARFALAAAMHLAGEPDAQVLVIAIGPGIERAQDDADAAVVAGPGRVAVSVLRLEGDPGDLLVEASDGLDLLLCGSHGRGRLLSAVLGSVSAHLLEAAHCPVLIVPPPIRPRPAAPLGLTTAAG